MTQTMRSILMGLFPSVVPAGWWREPSVKRLARGDLAQRPIGAHPLHRWKRGGVGVQAAALGRPARMRGRPISG